MINKFLIVKILPLIIALSVGYWFYLEYDLAYNKKTKPIYEKEYRFSNYDSDLALEKIVSAINSENTILLIGSSELGTSVTKLNARADLFFQKQEASLSLVSLGHAGNQSFSIYSQLLALEDYIEDSKISIIISPGWFSNGYEKGTSLETFLEFNKSFFLRNIYSNANDSLKHYAFQYIQKEYINIQEPSEILQLIYDYQILNYSPIKGFFHYPIAKFHNIIDLIDVPIMEDEIDYLIDFDKKEIKIEANINWDSIFNISIEYQKEISSNNNWYIYNQYYSKYTKGNKAHHNINKITDMQEFKDFKMLLYLLDYYNVDASFIIPPLNPYVYDNLADFKPILAEIENEIEEYKFPYSNMFVYDTTNYTPGLLTDVMHLGEYGWFKIDKFLIDTYENK